MGYSTLGLSDWDLSTLVPRLKMKAVQRERSKPRPQFVDPLILLDPKTGLKTQPELAMVELLELQNIDTVIAEIHPIGVDNGLDPWERPSMERKKKILSNVFTQVPTAEWIIELPCVTSTSREGLICHSYAMKQSGYGIGAYSTTFIQ